jgi:site-specific recombinase XerD
MTGIACTVRVPTDVNRAPSNSTTLLIHLIITLYKTRLILLPDEDEEDLFLGQRGPLLEWGIHAIVKNCAYQARLEGVTAHTLHHSFAKNLVDAGTPLDQVATLLGHESLDTTRIYTQPSERDLERAVQHAAGEIVDG